MAAHKISLFEAKKNGKPKGALRARWSDGGKQRIFNTGTRDRAEAMRRAELEASRLPILHVGTDGKPYVLEPPRPAPSSSSNGHTNGVTMNRRPLAEAFGRALNPDGVATPPAPALLTPEGQAAVAELAEQKKKAATLYRNFGKLMMHLNRIALERTCRALGREPGEMDEDEELMLEGAWEEKGKEWFGRTEMGPWGTIAMVSIGSGASMYFAGKPIPKPKQLEPAPQPEKNEKPGGPTSG